MLLLIPIIIVALAAGSYLLARGSGAFAYVLSRVVEAISGFVNYKASLRSVRTSGMRRSRGVRVAYKTS
ncbi:MAG: hypothetical protein H0U54_00170 [Acidobacteria bacterium]|nr:hypothetical protein [Acidobacteriota bacterium]